MKILLFNAIWCKDCKTMKPLWRNLRLENPKVEIKNLEVDNHKRYCKLFNIIDVPTAVFIDNEGKELERCVGVQHKDFIIKLIKKYKNL